MFDIVYMFSMAHVDENGEMPREELIAFYHGEFTKSLKTFGYSRVPPSLTDLQNELKQLKMLEVLLGIALTPYNFIDREKMKVEVFFDTDPEKNRELKKNLYNHPLCSLILQRDLKSWKEQGFLDFD
jgi:hypothetical protein